MSKLYDTFYAECGLDIVAHETPSGLYIWRITNPELLDSGTATTMRVARAEAARALRGLLTEDLRKLKEWEESE